MAAISAQGTTFTLDNGGAPIAIGCVVSFDGPGGSANVIDATCLSSTAKEKSVGLNDNGQITLNLNYLPSDAGQKRLQALRTASPNVSEQMVITLSSGETWTMDVFVLSFSISGGVDDKVNATCAMEISGSIVVA